MNENCGWRIADCGMADGGRGRLCAPGSHRLIRNPKSEIRNRRAAVTLVELLVVMVILAILGAAVLGTASAAMEAARERRTVSLINQIHGLIMERYASYGTRRIDLHPTITTAINNYVNGATTPEERARRMAERGGLLADVRLLGLRELVKYEMPDRWSDIDPTSAPIVLEAPPALARAYARRFQQAQGAASFRVNQGAECLYLTVMYATADGEARTLFSEQNIGDVDEDGAPEFLDGWGRPISWLRWAPGFVSPLQPQDASADHDPFDVYRRDQDGVPHLPGVLNGLGGCRAQLQLIQDRNNNGLSAYRLTPLIYSRGGDGESGINSKNDTYIAPLDPYFAGTGTQPGTIDNRELAIDNIHNHVIEY